MSGLIEHPYPQGSLEWLAARAGVITASRAKDARDFDKKGQPTAKRLGYAMDLARLRCGGKVAEAYVNAAMRMGSDEEQFAAIEYMARTGARIDEACFISTPDRKFGVSLDRWVNGRSGALEIKTMVSSATLFKALAGGDISEYRDQCVFALWLLVLDWIDLCLWCPDLGVLRVIRIQRDEDEIQKLEDDMLEFDHVVCGYEARLRQAISRAGATEATEAPEAPQAPGEPGSTEAPPLAEPAAAPAPHPATPTAALVSDPFA